jgi:hypothetical protein
MARQPLSRAPDPEPAGPALAPPNTQPALQPTAEELAKRRLLVAGMLNDGHPLSYIVDVATIQLGVNEGQVRATIRELRHQLLEEEAEARPFRQLAQVQRLRADVAKMRGLPRQPWSSVGTHEKLIAEIEGNLAPRRIKHEIAAVPDALAAVVNSLSEADVEREILEQREHMKKLAAITTTAEAAE